MPRAVGYLFKVASLVGLAVVLAVVLSPSPAAAQVVDTSEPCNGDDDHHSHGWPGHQCNLYWNPHYSVEQISPCHQIARHCSACFNCCEKRRTERRSASVSCSRREWAGRSATRESTTPSITAARTPGAWVSSWTAVREFLDGC